MPRRASLRSVALCGLLLAAAPSAAHAAMHRLTGTVHWDQRTTYDETAPGSTTTTTARLHVDLTVRMGRRPGAGWIPWDNGSSFVGSYNATSTTTQTGCTRTTTWEAHDRGRLRRHPSGLDRVAPVMQASFGPTLGIGSAHPRRSQHQLLLAPVLQADETITEGRCDGTSAITHDRRSLINGENLTTMCTPAGVQHPEQLPPAGIGALVGVRRAHGGGWSFDCQVTRTIPGGAGPVQSTQTIVDRISGTVRPE